MSVVLSLLPEIGLLAVTLMVLLGGVFFAERWPRLPILLTQFGLVLTMGLVGLVWHHAPYQTTFDFLDGQLIYDHVTVVLQCFICLAAFIALFYAHGYNAVRHIAATEFCVLSLLSVLGMMVLVSSGSLLVLFLGLECMSLPIYAMVALARKRRESVEAAMKYFLMGAMSTGILLYGMSMIFGMTRSLDIQTIAAFIAQVPPSQNILCLMGLVFLVVGVAFKLGAAPFHMWVPDVYEGAPSSVTLFIASVPKIAVFGLMIRLVSTAFPSLQSHWSGMWMVVAVLSMAVGNIAALAQTRIKRLLAYSSIAHMGYMVLGFVCGTARGIEAALFYVLSYTLMTLAAFGVVVLLSRDGDEVDRIDDLAGLSRRHPLAAFVMLVVMFSMAGIPPLVGFFAKVGILEALISAHLTAYAVVAILFAIVGAYYYIRVVKVMYFDSVVVPVSPVLSSRSMTVMLSLNGLAILMLGIFPGVLFSLSHFAL